MAGPAAKERLHISVLEIHDMGRAETALNNFQHASSQFTIDKVTGVYSTAGPVSCRKLVDDRPIQAVELLGSAYCVVENLPLYFNRHSRNLGHRGATVSIPQRQSQAPTEGRFDIAAAFDVCWVGVRLDSSNDIRIAGSDILWGVALAKVCTFGRPTDDHNISYIFTASTSMFLINR